MERLHASFKSGTRYEQMHKTGIKKEAKVMVRRDNPLSFPATPYDSLSLFSGFFASLPCLNISWQLVEHHSEAIVWSSHIS